MQIHDDHMFHGAALIQIAEHDRFTAINSLRIKGEVVRVGYRINDDIGIYLKYASKPTANKLKEYTFTFTKQHLDELEAISHTNPELFIGLICVRDRGICCVAYADLKVLIEGRQKDKGSVEDQYVILVTAPKGKAFRVYINAPGKKNTTLGKVQKVARNSFPNVIFQ